MQHQDPESFAIADLHGLMALVGESPAAIRLRRQLAMVAKSPAPVLIRGRAGAGKLDAAKAIYRLGGYPGRLQAVNCATPNPVLLEEQLFGRARGAYGPGDRGQAGAFARCENGVVFLDEVASLAAATQMKLIRVLDEREVIPVGASRGVAISARLISATGRDLRTMASAGRFREDLFYRLDAIPLAIPRLCQRSDDIPAMAYHYFAHLHQGVRPAGIGPEAMRALQGHAWPGNLREFCAALQAAGLAASGAKLQLCHLPPELRPRRDMSRAAQAERIRADLAQALAESGGNITAAARILGVSRTTVAKRMKKYGLKVSATIKPARER